MVLIWGCLALCLSVSGQGRAASATTDLDTLRQLLRAGHYAEAESAARTLLVKVEAADAPDSLATADVLDLLVQSMRQAGKAGDPEARGFAERSLRIREMALGHNDPAYAASLESLALLDYYNQNYAAALPPLERSLKIQETASGPNDLAVATTLLYLGAVRSDMGEFSVAKPLIERALTVREAALGPDHEDVAACLNALAVLLYLTGDYTEALPIYERVLRIWRSALGPDNPKVATCLHNLGALELEMADFDSAQRHLEEALRIREKSLGPRHELVANTLTALASTWRAEGDLDRSRSLYERALKIQRERYGANHQEVGWILARLGFLSIERKDFQEAKSQLAKAVADLEGGLGPDHLDVAFALAGLATATAALGDSATANPLYQRALGIQERVIGPTHPEVAVTLDEFARSLARFDDFDRSLECALRSEKIMREQLRTAARSLSEEQALGLAGLRLPAYGSPHPPPLRFAIAVLARDTERTPEDVARVWDAAIRSRTLVLDEVATRNRTVGEVSRYARAFEAARQRLSNLLVRGPSGEDAETYRALVSRARAESDEAEHALADRSASFRLGQARSQIGWPQVESSLPSGSALVAFSVGGDPSDEIYVAFVARAGERAVSVVLLGRSKEIDALVSKWDREAGHGALSGRDSRQAEQAYREAGTALRRRVWDPLASRLEGSSRVFIVPDGSLNLVSFAAFPVERVEYLVERPPLIHYLSAERDLVPTPLPEKKGIGLLAIGGPSFDASPGLADGNGAASGGARVRGVNAEGDGADRGSWPDCEEFRSVRFEPLPQSVREVEDIDSLWSGSGDAILLTGPFATEAAVRQQSPGRWIVHIATHGFFLAGRCVSPRSGERGIGGLEAEGERRPPRTVESPLRLSGLALAGANRRNVVSLDEQDGILTAEEISSLDLSGVDWVVLSGCETGLGEVRVGEGVLGLRRAFQVAGAGTVIMSLWPVDDAAARRWMQGLYGGRLKQRLGTAEAVRTASLDVLQERRAQALSTHPFYWAAFVATGEWK